MGKTIISAPSENLLIDYGDEFTHSYSDSVCHIYKVGRMCYFFYGTYWGGFAANTSYNIGQLPADCIPAFNFYAPAIMTRESGTYDGPLQVWFSASDGSVSVSTAHAAVYQAMSGWVGIAICFPIK